MDVAPDKLADLVDQYQKQADKEVLYQIGRVLLDESDAKDGKLLFLMRVSVDQFNSSLATPVPDPSFIGVYASPISRECSMYPANPTISREKPFVTLHEAKKFLHYVVHDRPSMIELLFTHRDHYMTSEWEILRANVRRVVSTKLAAKVLQIVSGNVDNICHAKYKRHPTRVQNTFYIATRMLATVESLALRGEMDLHLVAGEYLEEILQGKYAAETLKERTKTKMEELESLVKVNSANLRETIDLAFLNDWLIETVRRPTLPV